MRRSRFHVGKAHTNRGRYRAGTGDATRPPIFEATQGSLVDAVDRDVGYWACHRLTARQWQPDELDCEDHGQLVSPVKSSSASAGTRNTASALTSLRRNHASTSEKLSPSVST